MSKYFSIDGYWKDDKSEFSGYIVREFDDLPSEGEPYSDDDIFFYGLSEEDIKTAIRLGEGTVQEFVITKYQVL